MLYAARRLASNLGIHVFIVYTMGVGSHLQYSNIRLAIKIYLLLAFAFYIFLHILPIISQIWIQYTLEICHSRNVQIFELLTHTREISDSSIFI